MHMQTLAGEEQRSRLCEKKCLPITAAWLGDLITKAVKGARCGGRAGEQEAQFTARLDITKSQRCFLGKEKKEGGKRSRKRRKTN